jgi:hypothetical protein
MAIIVLTNQGDRYGTPDPRAPVSARLGGPGLGRG